MIKLMERERQEVITQMNREILEHCLRMTRGMWRGIERAEEMKQPRKDRRGREKDGGGGTDNGSVAAKQKRV